MTKHWAYILVLFLIALPGLTADSYGQQLTSNLSDEQKTLLDEHVMGGLPGIGFTLIRQGYVASYDAERRVPTWVAYHVTPAYLDTPKRESRFSRFRTDPDLDNPVVRSDYTHSGYARGHLAPFAVMGGDRDADSLRADLDNDITDLDDEKTVFEANYMSNMTPQHQAAFNGAGGIWFKLERWIQDTLVKEDSMDVWVFAGSIFGPGETEHIGPDSSIAVPPLFFKMVITKDEEDDPRVLAFLLPHHRVRHGDIEDYLVSVDIIEALTGLDFFNALADDQETALERIDTFETWETHFNPPSSTAKAEN